MTFYLSLCWNAAVNPEKVYPIYTTLKTQDSIRLEQLLPRPSLSVTAYGISLKLIQSWLALFFYAETACTTVRALRLEPRQRMTSAELAALAARCQLYGAWWPPFSPKCTIVSNSAARHRRQRRPVRCLLKAVLSVTSQSRMYCRWGRHCLHTCPAASNYTAVIHIYATQDSQ